MRRLRAPPLGESCERDGHKQRDAVEQRLDEKGATELLNPRDADGQNQDADDCAPHVDASGPNRRRPEEGSYERGQQIVETDIRLANLELRRKHAAREANEQSRCDEHADHMDPNRNAVERGRLLVGADRVDMSAERHSLRDDPEHDRQQQCIHSRHRNAEDGQAVDIHEALRQHTDYLTPIGVPERKRIQDGAGPQRRDEGINLGDLDEDSVDQPRGAAAQDDDEARERPRKIVLNLESYGEDVPHHDAEANREVDAAGHHRHHRRQRQQRDDPLVTQDRTCVDRGGKRIGEQQREEGNQEDGQDRQAVHRQHTDDRLAAAECRQLRTCRLQGVRFQGLHRVLAAPVRRSPRPPPAGFLRTDRRPPAPLLPVRDRRPARGGRFWPPLRNPSKR